MEPRTSLRPLSWSVVVAESGVGEASWTDLGGGEDCGLISRFPPTSFRVMPAMAAFSSIGLTSPLLPANAALPIA